MGIFDKVLDNIIEEAKHGMVKAAESLLADANEQVPVQSGKLRESGHIEKTDQEVSVVYDAEYALEVHEDPNGRGYKWLERTADMNQSKYEGIIAGGGK